MSVLCYVKICLLSSLHSSVPNPVHTNTCHQTPYLFYSMSFISQTTLSWHALVKKLKTGVILMLIEWWPCCFPFSSDPCLPPIRFHRLPLILNKFLFRIWNFSLHPVPCPWLYRQLQPPGGHMEKWQVDFPKNPWWKKALWSNFCPGSVVNKERETHG